MQDHPLGLSLEGFRELIDIHGGRAAFSGLTTAAVKYKVVLPSTGHLRTSYAAQLQRLDSPHVRSANKFISHSYDSLFLDVVDAVTAWEERQCAGSPFFYYFDLLVVNQHGQSAVVPFEVLRNEFAGGVRNIAHTLLVLNWDKPLPLTRAWCIFEVAITLAHKARLEILMPPAESAKLCNILAHDFVSVEKRLCTIDASAATAKEAKDEENIKRMIEEELGSFGEVNELVLCELREYILLVADAQLKQCRDSFTTELAVTLGDFMKTMGRTHESGKHLKLVLAAREELLKAEPNNRDYNLSVACALSSLGSTMRQGTDGAIPMLKRALDIQSDYLPDDDIALLSTTSRLGVAHKDAGDYFKALPFYERAYEGKRSKLAKDHPSTIFSHMNLAMLYDQIGRHSEHDAIVCEVLVSRRKVLGERHPQTLFANCRLGLALMRKGDLSEAEREMDHVCRLQAMVCGKKHTETLLSRAQRAYIWRKQGRGTKAIDEIREVREELQGILKGTHFEILRVTFELAEMLLEDNDDPAPGLKMYISAVSGALEAGSIARLTNYLDCAKRAADNWQHTSVLNQQHCALAAELLAAVSACSPCSSRADD